MFENFLNDELNEINRGLMKLAKLMARRRLEEQMSTKYGFVPSQAAMSGQAAGQDMGGGMPMDAMSMGGGMPMDAMSMGGGMPMDAMPMDMSQQGMGGMQGLGVQIDPSVLSQIMAMDPSSLGMGIGIPPSSSPISAMTPETIASAVVKELRKSTEDEGKSKAKSKVDLNSAIQTISQDVYQIKRLLVNLYSAHDIPMPPDILDDPNREMTVSASDNRHQKVNKIGYPFSQIETRNEEGNEIESLSDTASAVADLIRRIKGNSDR